MQVISGKYKGMALLSPEGEDTRPTLGRVKEAVFSAIQFDIADRLFLDLFSGSGQMGIEAVSRGASGAVLCEKDGRAYSVIKHNLRRLTGENIITENIDYIECIAKYKGSRKIGVVYIDPPFKQYLQADAVKRLIESDALEDGALIVTESLKNDGALDGLFASPQILLRRQYNYSKILISVFVYNSTAGTEVKI